MLRRQRLAMRGPQVYPYQVRLDPALVMFLQMNEGAGIKAIDPTINKHNCSFVNTPVWTTGVRDKALKFNGTNNRLQASTITQPTTGSINFWFTPKTTINAGNKPTSCIIGFDKAGVSTNFEAAFFADAEMTFRIYDGGVHDAVTTQAVWTASVWYNVCLLYGTCPMRIFINGVEDGTNTDITSGNASDRFMIGSRSNNTHYFAGSVDEVMIFNRRLSIQEILDIYERTKPLN